jgi:hypothetical protein
MKTIIVYDQNNMEAVLATACLVQLGDYKVVESRAFPPQAEEYIWIGCTHTTQHALYDRSILEAKHVVFVDLHKAKGVRNSLANEADYKHSVADKPSDASAQDAVRSNDPLTERVYGKITLIERVLSYFGHDVNKYAVPIRYATEFYKKGLLEEDLYEITHNMQEAVKCLQSGEPYSPIPFTTISAEAAYLAYKELSDLTKVIIDTRSNRAWFTDQNKRKWEVFTFYELDNWWFIRRRFWLDNKVCRNIATSATGVLVSTNVSYLEEIPQLDAIHLA